MRKEDEAAALSKKERVNTLMRQAAEANAQSLLEKTKRQQEEKAEDEAIRQHQLAKD